MSQEGAGIIRIFAGKTAKSFAKKMCDYLDTPLGESTAKTFSDGNTFVRIDEPIRNKDVYLIQGIGENPNDEFVEMLFWIDACKRASANSVTVVMPFFSYAKGDKKDEPRVSIRARVVAECIELEGADRIVTMELHSPQVQGFFKKPLDHLYAHPLLCEYIKRLNLVTENFIVVSPDAGYAKRARNYADILNVPLAISEKMRYGHDEKAKCMNIIGDVEGKDCLITDDFTISGGTLDEVARGLKDRGANKIYAALSHILLKPAGVELINKSPIELLITTDSVHCEAAKDCPKVRIISAAPLFAETIRLIHEKEPVGRMFEHIPERVFKMSFCKQESFL